MLDCFDYQIQCEEFYSEEFNYPHGLEKGGEYSLQELMLEDANIHGRIKNSNALFVIEKGILYTKDYSSSFEVAKMDKKWFRYTYVITHINY